jgi:cobalt transporter subunit CbtA
MADFRQLATISLIAGIVAGFLLSGLQHYLMQPLIFAAEQLEIPSPEHNHDWQPDDGFQRNSLTVLFNSLVGFGFALVLTAGMYLKNHSGLQHGLIWGLAGYAVFFVAPSLGLPPELPGTENAALLNRQTWWLFTAISTACGLAAICFNKNRMWQIGGVILLALPHIIGAPHPEMFSALAPENLQHQFVLFSALSNGIFWLTLGSVTGYFFKKWAFKND